MQLCGEQCASTYISIPSESTVSTGEGVLRDSAAEIERKGTCARLDSFNRVHVVDSRLGRRGTVVDVPACRP